ncbi:hypothetical protein V8C35DRAFT_278629 [Trichoderma chlorosporum]
MGEISGEDRLYGSSGLQDALAEGMEEMDVDRMDLDGATFQDCPTTAVVSHDADVDYLERDQMAVDANVQATMLENQLNLARAEVQRLTRRVTIEDIMPVLELYRQYIRIVCPLNGSERQKWVGSLERCLKLQTRFQEKGERCRFVQVQCGKLRKECEDIRAECLNSSRYFDKFQEKVNILFEEDGDDDEDDDDAQKVYDMMRDRMGQQEQDLEDSLSRTTEMIEMVDDMFIWVVKVETKCALHVHHLRRFEGVLDDILRSFDYWFGSV